jgi:type VII secretion integral membrane protein EccD
VTGVDELRNVRVMSAAPDRVRVAVIGGRTQLDVALPSDVPVATFLPELARLIGSRDKPRDDDVADRDERRTFWVLSRGDDDEALAPHETLRATGIADGELLRISPERALSPPTLHDDVVDAAARLNRAAYAPWNATAAAVMAFTGVWLCTTVWVVLLAADALSAHRGWVIGGAALTAVASVGCATFAHRTLGRGDIATAVGWSAIALTAAIGWVLAEGHGAYGVATACAVLLALTAACYRLIGVGHWAYIVAGVVFTFGGCALLARGLGAPAEVLAAAASTSAALACLAVPTLTARLAQSPPPTAEPTPDDGEVDDPFGSAAGEPTIAAALPSAEEVWARVRSATFTRSGLLTGLAVVVAMGAAVLMTTRPSLPALMFGVVCAAVLALRSRRAPTVLERIALAVPAMVLVLVMCAQAQAGSWPVRLVAVGILVGGAALATTIGLMVTGGGVPQWISDAVAYLEYVAVAALIPLALWQLGVYERLGL